MNTTRLVIGLLAWGALSIATGGWMAKATAADANREAAEEAEPVGVDMFDAIDQGLVDVKFVARDSERGRLILSNKTNQPVDVLVPEAFAGVPVMRQFGGGMGGGGMGGGGMGGGQQGVGGGGGGRGGGGRGGRGGGGGRSNVPPEQITRVDVPLVCLDHGLKEPSTSKPYEVRPIEDVVQDASTIEIVAAYANGDLPFAAAQAAVWHTNSKVSWQELATKLTGTERNMFRGPYFSSAEIQTAMAIVQRAEQLTMGKTVEPRNWTPVSQRGEDGDTPENLNSDEAAEETSEEYHGYDPEIDGEL